MRSVRSKKFSFTREGFVVDTAKLIDLVLTVTPHSKEKFLKQRANNQGFLALTGFHS